MISVSEFCPRCQSLQGMEVTVSLREAVDPEGNLRKIVTKSYHCVNCRATLRSEDTEVVMISVSEFCPKCQSLQGIEVAVSQREEVDPEGNLRNIVTKSYHCANCRATLRSEDFELSQE